MGIEIIIGAIVGFTYLGVQFTIKNGFKKKCTSCGKWFAQRQLKTETIGQKQTMKMESYKVDSGEFEVIERNNKSLDPERNQCSEMFLLQNIATSTPMNVGFVKTIQSRIQKKYYSFLLKNITFRQI
jgi:hypothetical protein